MRTDVRRNVLAFAMLIGGVALVEAQALKRLPFSDGTYATDPAICRMTVEQQTRRFGDSVGAMVRNIEGRRLDNGYELSCDIVSASVSGSSIRFRANCQSEGEPNTVNGAWVKVDDRSFKIGNRTFVACGRLIR